MVIAECAQYDLTKTFNYFVRVLERTLWKKLNEKIPIFSHLIIKNSTIKNGWTKYGQNMLNDNYQIFLKKFRYFGVISNLPK